MRQKMLSSILPFIVFLCPLTAGVTFAQFREILPDETPHFGNRELTPTRQPFVSPKRNEEKAKPTAKVAQKQKKSASHGKRPTLAVPAEPKPVPATTSPKKSNPTMAAPQKTKASSSLQVLNRTASSPAEKTTEKKSAQEISSVGLPSDENVAIENDTVPSDDSVSATNQVSPTPAANEEVEPESEPTTTIQSPLDLFSVQPFDGTTNSAVVFNGVQAGEISIEELKEIWGQPAKIVDVDGVEKMIYKAPGFRQVDVFADGSGADDAQLNVESITIHLTEIANSSLLDRLDLNELPEVNVVDELGEPLGVAYPERGVLLGYKKASTDFDTLTLQPISAELFLLRVESSFDLDYTSDLNDLNLATQIDDKNAHAYWLKSELYSKVGVQSEAKAAIDKALSLAKEPLYQLTKARLLADEGEIGEARQITQVVVDDSTASNVVLARAKFQLGNLRATGADADFESAMTAHLEAIELAAKDLNNKNVKVRRMAKDILVDAHLSVAQDIALGNFQRQQQVVPKWLIRATELAEKFIEEDRGDESKRLDIFRSTLAIYSILPGNFDASVAAEDGLLEGNRLISQSQDELFQTKIRRTLIEMLYYAAKVEHLRGRADNALQYAEDAISLIGKIDVKDTKLFDKYIYGQLYFLVGSLHAIGKNDHQVATEWYARAAEIFTDNDFSLLTNPNLFGDLLVSMGVSYWEVGEKEKAVAITEQGVQLMQDGVQEGLFDLESLAIPYTNLAAMHKSLGNQTDSKHYVEMASKIDSQVRKR